LIFGSGNPNRLTKRTGLKRSTGSALPSAGTLKIQYTTSFGSPSTVGYV
jgi:hypothetical protein